MGYSWRCVLRTTRESQLAGRPPNAAPRARTAQHRPAMTLNRERQHRSIPVRRFNTVQLGRGHLSVFPIQSIPRLGQHIDQPAVRDRTHRQSEQELAERLDRHANNVPPHDRRHHATNDKSRGSQYRSRAGILCV